MSSSNKTFSPLVFIIICAIGVTFTTILGFVGVNIANQCEKTVVLRLGKFHEERGPGFFFIIPIVDTIAYWIDTRVVPTNFKAKKAALNVSDYMGAIGWTSPTALRDVMGKELKKIINGRTEPWGVQVVSVEVKDVLIPSALEDAMSMQAQAERERQARVILGDSKRQVAEKFKEAALSYADNPVALYLRSMNMLYEELKQNSTIVLVPNGKKNNNPHLQSCRAVSEYMGLTKDVRTGHVQDYLISLFPLTVSMKKSFVSIIIVQNIGKKKKILVALGSVQLSVERQMAV